MIRSDKQYRATLEALEGFRVTLKQTQESPPGKRRDLAVNGLRAQIHDLEADIRAYDGVKTAAGKMRFDGRFEDLPLLLQQARVARGWTQQELGDRVGVHQQTIARYEAGEYDRASFERLKHIAQALGAKASVRLELVQMPSAIDASLAKSRNATPLKRRRRKVD